MPTLRLLATLALLLTITMPIESLPAADANAATLLAPWSGPYGGVPP